jgi:hypothetical protein
MRTQVVITLDFETDDVDYDDVAKYLQELIDDESLSYEVITLPPS